MNNIVTASQMRRPMWIAFRWENVTELADKEPRYLCAGIRPIEQAVEAGKQFDEWVKNYRVAAERAEVAP